MKNRHVIYSQLATVLPFAGEIIKSATLGIGGLVSGGIQVSLHNWQRMADFSADRAALLACQDIEVAARALIKLGDLARLTSTASRPRRGTSAATTSRPLTSSQESSASS